MARAERESVLGEKDAVARAEADRLKAEKVAAEGRAAAAGAQLEAAAAAGAAQVRWRASSFGSYLTANGTMAMHVEAFRLTPSVPAAICFTTSV